MRVDGVAHRVGVPVLGEVDMARPARARARPHRCARRRWTSTLSPQNAAIAAAQHALHRRPVVLALPADERRAVVFDRELVARHGALSPRRVPARNARAAQKSSAFIACLPARCNSRMRTAPSPHAIVSASSSTVPGAPAPSPRVVRSTLMRPARPPISHQAPGNGDRPRTWSCTCFHGLRQSMRVSVLVDLAPRR